MKKPRLRQGESSVIHFCRTSTAILLATLIALPTTAFAASNADTALPTPLTYHGLPIANVPPIAGDHSAPIRTETPSNAFGQWGYGHHGRHHNDAAVTAMVLGAAGVIAGSAVLVYANRPDCSANPNLGGCGYGTRVVGGAVLSAGLVGLLVGALTWR